MPRMLARGSVSPPARNGVWSQGEHGGLEAVHVAHGKGLCAVGQPQLLVLRVGGQPPLESHAVPGGKGLRGGWTLLELEVVWDGAADLQRGQLGNLHIQDAEGRHSVHHFAAEQEHTCHSAHLQAALPLPLVALGIDAHIVVARDHRGINI